MITAVCVFVKGHVGFTPEYVVRLQSTLVRTLHLRHRFVCFTDQPDAFGERCDGDIVEIETPRGMFAWWAKVELFNRARGLTGRVLYLDLDVLPVGSLNEIAHYPAPFALIPHAGQWRGKGAKKTVPLYNSSVMVFDADERVWPLYDRWSPSVTDRLWGDQDWIAQQMPGEATMPLAWFPRLSEIDCERNFPARPNWPSQAKVVLCKKPKNHDAVKRWPWFDAEWR